MCGFTAYLGPDAPDQHGMIERLGAALRHRGPDDGGLFATAGAAFAHRRLSIIDVAGGKQPMVSEDGRTAMVCNGEIYNHRNLRLDLEARHRFATHSDCEVILHLYEDKGPACLADLDGMFAFVVANDRGFLAARDPFGIKPLYVGRGVGAGFWFASELRAIPVGCDEILELPPGTFLTQDGVIRRWFAPGWAEPARAPVAPEPQTLARRLDAAVTKRLMSDVPLGVFLSGGLDSSVIAALVARRVPSLHSFAVGIEGSPDILAARAVSSHLSTRHHEILYSVEDAVEALPTVIAHLESYDEALIRSAVPCFFLSKLTAEYVKVVLSGEGSDELFAGYGYFAGLTDPGALHKECVRLLGGLHNMNLQRVDRMTMAHGLEARVPFLDVDFSAWAMALDPAEKLHRQGRPEKWLLRCAFEELLPADIVWRSKQEFAQGCGSEPMLKAHGEQAVSDHDWSQAAALFPLDTPTSKEAFLYRRIFAELFPKEAQRLTVGRWRGELAAP